ncbi:protein phosphatase 2C domain-containing protein [Epibacterium ulvae]|uniref:Protein phosphatase 2C n=1 Tax=Epibacterium ulvae TaxID=1156985 RepID=A0A1G5Q6Q0_9RHOB|nr:protein phosphatase 2C domain-containing protein [Epibacterium ulvae]SCZ57140.1 Protein phosphatase 2C [Epibacterium ulvae]
MHFEILQSISANGTRHKANDDRVGATHTRAWVIDGATDMGPPGLLGAQGGAAWLATTASTLFASLPETDIRTTCHAALSQIEARFEAQKTRELAAAWELPKAAFALAQLNDTTLSVAWASDCPVLLITKTGTQWCTGAPDTRVESAEARALGAGAGTDGIFAEHVLADRRAQREKSDFTTLNPNASAAQQALHYAELQVVPGDELLLMTDGFSSLISDYQRYTAQSLAQALREKGLPSLVEEIRIIEQKDATCQRFPRFKISDDATALWLRI